MTISYGIHQSNLLWSKYFNDWFAGGTRDLPMVSEWKTRAGLRVKLKNFWILIIFGNTNKKFLLSALPLTWLMWYKGCVSFHVDFMWFLTSSECVEWFTTGYLIGFFLIIIHWINLSPFLCESYICINTGNFAVIQSIEYW